MLKANKVNIINVFLMIKEFSDKYDYEQYENKKLYINTSNNQKYEYSYSHKEYKLDICERDICVYEESDCELRKILEDFHTTNRYLEKYKISTKLIDIINKKSNEINKCNELDINRVEYFAKEQYQKELFHNFFEELNHNESDVCVFDYGESYKYVKLVTQAIFYRKGNAIIVYIPDISFNNKMSLKVEIYLLEQKLPLHTDLLELATDIFEKEISIDIKEELINSFKTPITNFKIKKSYIDFSLISKDIRLLKLKRKRV